MTNRSAAMKTDEEIAEELAEEETNASAEFREYYTRTDWLRDALIRERQRAERAKAKLVELKRIVKIWCDNEQAELALQNQETKR